MLCLPCQLNMAKPLSGLTSREFLDDIKAWQHTTRLKFYQCSR